MIIIQINVKFHFNINAEDEILADAGKYGNRLMIRPIHRYIHIGSGKEIVQVEQGIFQGWM